MQHEQHLSKTGDEELTERGLAALVSDGIYSQALGVLTGGALLTGCALALGASPGFVGLLAAVPFFAQLAHVPGIVLIEKLRRRKTICVAVTLAARLLLLPLLFVPLIPSQNVALGVLLAVFVAVATLGAIGGCAWMSWTCDLVPAHRLGAVFARRQLRANVSGVVAALLGGAIADGWARWSPSTPAGGYVGVFLLAVAAAMASTWYLTRMPDVPMPSAPPRGACGIGGLFIQPFRDVNFRRLMGFLGSWNLAVNLATPFFMVYLLQDLHCGIGTGVALTIVAQLANAASLPVWGSMSDRFSNKTVISVCAPLFLACLIGWVLAGQPAPHSLTLPLIAGIQLLVGISTGGLDLACGNIALKLAPRGEATVYLGANSLVKSLCAGFAPVLGGQFADQLSGMSFAFTLHWQDGKGAGEVMLLHVAPWHVFFLSSALFGLFALARLSRVYEPGEVPLATLRGRLVRKAGRRVALAAASLTAARRAGVSEG
jgi:MFS family permease